jgi:hypothetical protein
VLVRSRPLVALVVALVLAAGCQLDLAVDIRVDDDGSGVVTIGVGLDDDALARAGNLEEQLYVDDLRQAGWTVSEPTREGELTWVRASKPFADPDAGTSVLAEVTGPDGAFREFVVTREGSALGTTSRVRGVVDLTAGPAVFSDAELAAALDGDPFGGTLTSIEEEEGRPIEEMTSIRVSIDLPGSRPKVYTASFADEEPLAIDASARRGSVLASTWIWGLLALVAVIALVVLRQGFRRVRA